uniref:Ig-like domain-containing protein n=1 Tax=Xiphophorus maculatus TaxID=8083 RepID=A0A3B5QB20_XIPMA
MLRLLRIRYSFCCYPFPEVGSIENVTLPCGAAENQQVLVVNWSRTDLGSDYVLLYRDEQFDPEQQSASFTNRVNLKAVDRGDPSLILSNVTTSDAGTYECRVAYEDGNEKRRTLTLISTINLKGEPSESVFEGRDLYVRMLTHLQKNLSILHLNYEDVSMHCFNKHT